METKYRRHIRLKSYDYSINGYYFVTICCSYVAAERQLCHQYKEIIEEHLKRLERNAGVQLDFYVIMPEHIHFILVLDDSDTRKAGALQLHLPIHLPLYRYIQDFKSKTTLEIKRKGFAGKRFWQPNYYEHVIRNEKALEKIRAYIQNNPEKEKYNWDELDK
ncbi:MAG: transposase [Elusimicrobiota bacterium]